MTATVKYWKTYPSHQVQMLYGNAPHRLSILAHPTFNSTVALQSLWKENFYHRSECFKGRNFLFAQTVMSLVRKVLNQG